VPVLGRHPHRQVGGLRAAHYSVDVGGQPISVDLIDPAGTANSK
jgi:hypothetical protein